MDWISAHKLLISLLSLAVTALGVWWLMPSTRSRIVGVVLALLGSGVLAATLRVATGPIPENILFWIFATGALIFAVMMITSRNPVYAALWFALVTLSACGLFLLQSAPFLAAATVIVYAGAIVVTFLFVMMLAQQRGATIYDQHAFQPLVATVAAFVLLGALLYTLQLEATTATGESTVASAPAVVASNPLSRPDRNQSIGTMHSLGRSLFGDYLFVVELAGTVLMIATIGAIAMAPHRAEGTL